MSRRISHEMILQRYQRLIEISRDLASTLDLDHLLARIVQVASDLSESQEASILLYDENSHKLFFQTSTNIQEHPVLRGINVPLESLAGWVVTNRQPLIVNDVKNDGRHFNKVDKSTQFSTSSLMAIPMMTQDKVIGVLEVLNKHEGNYTQADEDLMLALGAQAAVAIQNTRLFQQTDLISELVHELRTPLSSLMALSSLVQRTEISEQQRANLTRTIQSETQRLNDLATSFLDLARLESGRASFHLSFFDLPPLIDECFSVTQSKAEEKGLTLRAEMAGELPKIEADRDKLKQVILNLLSNAIKYNRPGGCIQVRVDNDAQETGPGVLLAVADTGVGIPEDALPRLFTRFYRVQGSEKIATGTGLGLSICKRIVEAHNGCITAESQVGTGTTFSIHLPLLQKG